MIVLSSNDVFSLKKYPTFEGMAVIVVYVEDNVARTLRGVLRRKTDYSVLIGQDEILNKDITRIMFQ